MSVPPAAGPMLPDPASRGITRISPVVVERFAVWACRGVPGALTHETHPEVDQAPATRARAEVMGSSAHLSVTIGVGYPAPILPIAHEVRRAVTAEVEHMCGLGIIGVDVQPVPVAVRTTSRVR